MLTGAETICRMSKGKKEKTGKEERKKGWKIGTFLDDQMVINFQNPDYQTLCMYEYAEDAE